MASRYLSLARNTVKYFFANGTKKTLARMVHRLAGRIPYYEEPPPVLRLEEMFPPEAQKIPIQRVPNRNGKRRLSVVLPTLDQKHFFAGAWTAINILWQAKKKYGFRTRIICTNSAYDPEILGQLNFIDTKEIKEIGSWDRGGESCPVEEDEIFIVTAWWTAHVIKDLEDTNKIFYLVQDYEPAFYSWSYKYILALESYKFDYAKIFNTSSLYRFFDKRELLTGKNEMFFEPAVDGSMYYPGEKTNYQKTGKATILIYGRPRVPRNLFELATLSLDNLLTTYPEYKEKIGEIISVGESHNDLYVHDFCITSQGKLSLNEWAALARVSDVGISLMCSPHPSYPPLEMIASGMLVVTNKCYNKDLSQVNSNFISAEPSIESMTAAIKRALDRLPDQELIRHNAEFFLSQRNWDKNLEEVVAFIGRQALTEAESGVCSAGSAQAK